MSDASPSYSPIPGLNTGTLWLFYTGFSQRLGRSDVLVILLRKLWSRELRAVHDGCPLTSWRRPGEPLEISSRAE